MSNGSLHEIPFADGLGMVIRAASTKDLLNIVEICDSDPSNRDQETYEAIKFELSERGQLRNDAEAALEEHEV